MANTTPPEKPPTDSYQIIKDARTLIDSRPESTASKKSAANYVREVTRLAKKGKDLWATAQDTTSQNTWFLRRAAILHIATSEITLYLSRQDKLQRELRDVPKTDPRWAPWQKHITQINGWTDIIQKAPEGSPLINIKPRKSKRRLGPGLPVDWREKLAVRLPTWKTQYLIAAITGCRPVELAKGVKLEIQSNELVVTINGAKLSAQSGQEWRELRWTLSDATPLVEQLIAQVKATNGLLSVNLGTDNTNPARAFSDAIKAAAKREWPNRKLSITAYSLRHAAASDLKASNLNSAEISAALGHAVDATKSTYGHVICARGASVAPQKTSAARTVKNVQNTFIPSIKAKSQVRQRGNTPGF
jgi:integrase